ncbi:hypothetical protein [Paracidovorax wautersii]|uniref:hypothetical protein n=1 Tax=Paracidovorax wautersii TaxID=1177982 RepID=UPI0031CF4D97
MNRLSHLRLLHKFIILGLVGLLMSAVPTTLFVAQALDGIHNARLEARGTPALLALHKAVQELQVHRGLSAGMLGGNEVLAARRPTVRDAVNQALEQGSARFAEAGVPEALA